MSRFVSEQTIRIELDNGDWVDVRESIAFLRFKEIAKMVNPEKPIENIEMVMPLLKEALVGWSFDKEFSVENIEKLNFKTVQELSEPILKVYMPEKKSQTE